MRAGSRACDRLLDRVDLRGRSLQERARPVAQTREQAIHLLLGLLQRLRLGLLRLGDDPRRGLLGLRDDAFRFRAELVNLLLHPRFASR